jgi:hypothetical protein
MKPMEEDGRKVRTAETNQTRYWFTKLHLVIELFDIKRFEFLDFTLGLLNNN